MAGDVLEAAELARSDVVVVMDADFSHPPEALPALIAPILSGEHDVALGSRYVKGARISDWPWVRRLMSGIGTLAAWPLVDVCDPLSGYFAIRRERLLALGGEVHGFKLALEVLARSDNRLRTVEVPIHFRDRQQGTSKLGWR